MILLLLMVMIYIYAVLGIYIFVSYTLHPSRPQMRYKLESLPHAILTLFQLLTLDQWFSVDREFSNYLSVVTCKLYFISWVCVGAFIFRNIFVGAMVKNFETLDQDRKTIEAETKKKKAREDILEVIMQNNLQSQQVKVDTASATSPVPTAKVSKAPTPPEPAAAMPPPHNFADERALHSSANDYAYLMHGSNAEHQLFLTILFTNPAKCPE
jgi:cation channel sperm-associated protein 2